MQRLVGRRRALAWVGGTALAALAGCPQDMVFSDDGYTAALTVGL